jgi:hypothetical protein
VDLQAGQLFANVAAVGQNRRLLREPLRLDLDALWSVIDSLPEEEEAPKG